MKKKAETRDATEMRSEYEFRGGVRGKYADRFAEGTNIVVLDPDVAQAFPDSDAVNEALRYLLKFAQTPSGRTASSKIQAAGPDA